MGTNAKTEEDYSIREVEQNGIKLYSVLHRLEFPMDKWPPLAKLAELQKCLDNMWRNSDRWHLRKYMYESVLRRHMAFTLLVPGGKADRARQAVNLLSDAGYLLSPPAPSVIAKLIRPYVRFHNVKAKRLVNTLRKQWPKLVMRVLKVPECNGLEQKLRDINAWIQSHIPGLGQKATAHFMRNTGLWYYGFAFPLIDVHIHKALEALGYSHSTYQEAERSFWDLSAKVDIQVILLDAALWCAYANNWEFSNSDFDNFGYINKQC